MKRADWLEFRLPEASGNWVRFWPRRWPVSPRDSAWTHVGRQSLEMPASEGTEGHLDDSWTRAGELELLVRELDDVLYVPPASTSGQDLALEMMRFAAEAGIPCVGQCRPSQSADELEQLVQTAGDNTEILIDLTTLIVEPEQCVDAQTVASSRKKDERVVGLFPLVAGLSDGSETVHRVLDQAERMQLDSMRVVTLSPAPEVLRRLGSRLPDEAALALFHSGDPDLRSAERLMRGRGFEVWRDRPSPRGAALGRRRTASGVLCRIGETWTALGRAESAAQEFFVASRWLDDTALDLDALVREGNLRVVDRISPNVASVIVEWIESGRSSLLEELEREYFEG